MATEGGPSIIADGLIYYHDTGNFPKQWGVTQLVPDPEFSSNTRSHVAAVAFTDANYLGALGTGTMTGNSYIFSGGDSANYSISQPQIWGWNNGTLGSTGGNWMYYNILPTTADASRDFIVECKWRFVYVSKTGNGTLNPTFQIGRAYSPLYSKTFYNTGPSYDWQYTKFKINGADGNYHRKELTFGLSSADAAVELDYLRCYEINKITGLKNIVGTSTIDLSNVSFDANGQITFDGTNDYIGISPRKQYLITEPWTTELVFKPNDNIGSWNGLFGGNLKEGGYWMFHADGNLTYYEGSSAETGTKITYRTWTKANTFIVGEFHHLTITYNPTSSTTGTYTLYYNGGLKVDTFAWTFTWSHSLDMQKIGAGGSDRYGTSDIPVFKQYSRVLSAEEVQQNYNATKARFGL